RRCQELIFPPRLIISGGDVLKASYVDGLLPITNLFNTYGPTETTVCCSYAKVEALDSVALIGRPIGDCAIYVLNDSMNPVAIGEKGEMYVGGKGVAKGYFNKEHETSLRFLSNPFGEGLLYRTGDLGVWKRNGFLEFQGRCDDQVKINGYRIDPREIDSVLEQHTRIRDAYTVPRKNSHGNDILETFFTANSPVELTELRLFLS
ncbi:MAG: AMP-binding protein, partial [Flammeovirgaceae bacterium]